MCYLQNRYAAIRYDASIRVLQTIQLFMIDGIAPVCSQLIYFFPRFILSYAK